MVKYDNCLTYDLLKPFSVHIMMNYNDDYDEKGNENKKII